MELKHVIPNMEKTFGNWNLQVRIRWNSVGSTDV